MVYGVELTFSVLRPTVCCRCHQHGYKENLYFVHHQYNVAMRYLLLNTISFLVFDTCCPPVLPKRTR